MRVGDLVKFESEIADDMDRYSSDHGVVVQLSKTGHDTVSAQVLFSDGQLWWVGSQRLVVISEGG